MHLNQVRVNALLPAAPPIARIRESNSYAELEWSDQRQTGCLADLEDQVDPIPFVAKGG
jgi:hypothetical protein